MKSQADSLKVSTETKMRLRYASGILPFRYMKFLVKESKGKFICSLCGDVYIDQREQQACTTVCTRASILYPKPIYRRLLSIPFIVQVAITIGWPQHAAWCCFKYYQLND